MRNPPLSLAPAQQAAVDALCTFSQEATVEDSSIGRKAELG
jgi:hypothetical protein